MLPASLSSLHNTAPLLQILTKLVFLLSFCGQGSTPQVCVCLLSSSNNLFACLVLNWPVLSLLLWRNTLRLRGHLPPPASPPSFGNPYKNSGRSWTKTIVASKKNWKDPSNRCHHTLPPLSLLLFLCKSCPHTIPVWEMCCEWALIWKKCQCVNLCVCAPVYATHKIHEIPVDFFSASP